MRHCKWCGKELLDSYVDNQCDGCWEFTSRINMFLMRKRTVRFILKSILKFYWYRIKRIFK